MFVSRANAPFVSYIFEESDWFHARHSGALELAPKLRASFEAEPEWLEDEVWENTDGSDIRTE